MPRSFLLVSTLTAATLAGCATPPAFAITAAPTILTPRTSRVDVTLTNAGRRTARRVAVRCRFYDGDGRPLEVGAAYFSDVSAGASATEPVTVARGDVARGDCAVDPKRR